MKEADIYSQEGLDAFEDDEIFATEEICFMRGYLDD